MRDNMKPCNHNILNDAVYKDVVVIGNGPSGLVTSFMLAGNVPYLKEIPDDLPLDDMLRARLSHLGPGQSLYEADLMELAEGLEGRSTNPIPLLMDNLLRPCADMGITAEPLIDWRFEADKQIDHVVLGRDAPGGSWHTFPPRVLTLSPAAWLALPPHRAVGGGGGAGGGGAGGGGGRVPASAVANYCRRYVHKCRLQKYFRTGVVVTSVTRAPLLDSCERDCHRNYNFIVTGYEEGTLRSFRYVSPRVVVAAGGCARAAGTLSHAVTGLAELHSLLEHTSSPLPILVIGSGISSADAVLAARAPAPRREPTERHERNERREGSERHVHHVYRTTATALRGLNATDYPDYYEIYKMMCDGPSANYHNYTPHPDHVITDVTIQPGTKLPDKIAPKTVKLLNPKTNEIKQITVSIIAMFVGSRPDLFFLVFNYIPTLEPKCKCIDKRNDDTTQCFLKNHWHYLKTVLGQTVQICKSRYMNYTEINGNIDTKCIVDECNRLTKCTCKLAYIENGNKNCYNNLNDKVKCYCKQNNPYSDGLGLGRDPTKPIDGRANPIAIDTSTHQVLNAPKGVYALGPVTADNFIRFLPGGALAIVSHIHKEKTK